MDSTNQEEEENRDIYFNELTRVTYDGLCGNCPTCRWAKEFDIEDSFFW